MVYKPFFKQQEHDILVNKLPECFAEIEKWMASHYLQLNAGKTEIIVFAKPNVLSKLNIHGAFIKPSVCVRFVSTAKNLGIRLDSPLTMTPQVKHLKSTCFNTMRKIAKMKYFLSPKQLETLTHALIFSAMDYCNSLYFGISSANMQQLQVIQNRACRIVLGLKRRTSTDEHLKNLHWLKVKERVEYKLILLTFKCLNGTAPPYLSDLLHYNHISGSRTPSLQSSSQHSSVGDRAFVSCAPRLWNDLPNDLKQCSKLQTFKAKLKTHLFNKSHSV